jgi:phosphatidylglycerophosphate synthase
VLALRGKIQWWLTILVLSRDVMILTIAAVILLVSGYRPFPPSFYGKMTTTVQIVLVFLIVITAVFQQHWLMVLRQLFVYLVAAFTIFSGLHYSVVIARRVSSGS